MLFLIRQKQRRCAWIMDGSRRAALRTGAEVRVHIPSPSPRATGSKDVFAVGVPKELMIDAKEAINTACCATRVLDDGKSLLPLPRRHQERAMTFGRMLKGNGKEVAEGPNDYKSLSGETGRAAPHAYPAIPHRRRVQETHARTALNSSTFRVVSRGGRDGIGGILARAKRGWYQHSAKALYDIFGYRCAALRRTARRHVTATSVENNLINSLHAWANWISPARPTTKPLSLGYWATACRAPRAKTAFSTPGSTTPSPR